MTLDESVAVDAIGERSPPMLAAVTGAIEIDPPRYHEAADPSRAAVAQRPPVCLYLEVTNRCNLLCTTCPRTYVELEPPADLSWDLFRSIVDQIPDLQRAVLHGVGEPMLVKNLPQMVRYLKDRGTYVLFNTNGTVLNDRNGRAMIDAGLDELRVSLDASTRESYLAVRGVDYFERILRNVRRFRELQERGGHAKPRVSAWLTGLKETIGELPAFVKPRRRDRGPRGLPPAPRLLRDGCDRQGPPRPGAVREPRRRGSGAPARGGRSSRASLGVTFSASGAASEPGMSLEKQGGQQSLVAVRPALDGDVFHRQRPRPALLHRALRASRLRELHARRRHPGDPEGDLERRPLPGFPLRPPIRPAPHSLQPIAGCAGASDAVRIGDASAVVAMVIPCLDEEAAIGPLVRELVGARTSTR